MRFVSPKAEQAQLGSVIRRIRSGYIKERTACMNRVTLILLEFGVSFPRGHTGIGPMTASCCLSSVANADDFSNGRNFAAWIGLVPYQYSTGGKPRLLGISKRGNKELRELFVHAARAVMWRDESAEKYFGTWLLELKRRKPFNVAVVALANKIARIAWSVMCTHSSPLK